MSSRSISLILLWCGLTTGVQAQTISRSLLIRDVRVFNGEGVLEQRSVLVKNGKITSVGGRYLKFNRAEVIDGQGRTLLPASSTRTFTLAMKSRWNSHSRWA
jgi:hypothetical protein